MGLVKTNLVIRELGLWALREEGCLGLSSVTWPMIHQSCLFNEATAETQWSLLIVKHFDGHPAQHLQQNRSLYWWDEYMNE